MEGDKESRRSNKRCAFTIGWTIVSWISKLQQIVSLSTIEVEYVFATQVSKEMIWLQRFMEELGKKQENRRMYYDSESAFFVSLATISLLFLTCDDIPYLSLLRRYPFFVSLLTIYLICLSCENIPSLSLVKQQLLVIFIEMTKVGHRSCDKFLGSSLLRSFLDFIALSMECEVMFQRPNIRRNIYNIILVVEPNYLPDSEVFVFSHVYTP
jgi:hypothetical protein